MKKSGPNQYWDILTLVASKILLGSFLSSAPGGSRVLISATTLLTLGVEEGAAAFFATFTKPGGGGGDGVRGGVGKVDGAAFLAI